ncbi:MAG TPA: signal peptidase II [Acidiferrobacter sp.]|nr:signal peptidase II [Acidiferrobacter sp.]
MLAYLSIAIVVLGLDQWSKFEAIRHLAKAPIRLDHYLNLVLVYNRGAAFGFLSNQSGWQNLLFIVVAVVMVVGIVWFVTRLAHADRLIVVALMLVLGGALGNLTDRLRIGRVVDFIDFHIGSWHWYTFNLADSAITVGIVLIVLDAFVSRSTAVTEKS